MLPEVHNGVLESFILRRLILCVIHFQKTKHQDKKQTNSKTAQQTAAIRECIISQLLPAA